MKCQDIFKVHIEKHQAENKVTVVKDWQHTDRFYLCSECTGKLKDHDDYKKQEIVVEKIIHREEKRA